MCTWDMWKGCVQTFKTIEYVKQTYKLHGQISQGFIWLRFWDFQGIVFVWTGGVT